MKKLFFVTVLTLTAYSSLAQNTLTVIDTGNISRERWRDSVLRMDKSQITTGFLLEYSMFGFTGNKYDGVGNDDDTIKNDGRIFELHNILYNSKVNSSAVIDLTDTLFSKAFFYNLNTNVIPLTFIYQKYNRIRQTALSQNLLKIAPDSVGILDVAGRTTSPYDPYELFAFAPFKTTITQFNAIQFTLPADLFYMAGITSVDIDFGDGAGFKTIAKGGTASVYYATEGTKYVTARITTAGGTRIAKSLINYKRPVAYSQPDYKLNFQVPPVYTSDAQYLGGALATVQTAATVIPCSDESFIGQIMCSAMPNADIEVTNGCDKVFDKPIIVVEGFDPDGSIDIKEMQRRFFQNNFIATMQSYGFDFVFVNFTKNTTYIENNAKVLEAVINWVNQHKTGTNKSTVIGFSMGGLIARWCLKDMEDRGLQHNVGNYFSYDAPQQGANIPLGMQYIFKEIARDLPYLKWFSGSFRDLSNAFGSPAARQMLVTYADYSNSPFNWTPNLNTLSPLRAAFAQRLQAKGYPQQTNNYGIAFGRGNNIANKDAGDGKQFTLANPFSPKSQLFGGSIGLLLVNLEADGYAVSENNIKATTAYYSFFGLTFREIFGIPIRPVITLRVRRFDYTGQYPYDDGQGSFVQTQTEFAKSWFPGLGMPGTTYGHDGHNFVATASALDLQNQTYNAATSWQSANIFYNVDNQIQNPGKVNGNTLITPSLSPFKAVMTSTSDCAVIGGCSAQPYGDQNNNAVFPPNNNLWNHFHNTDMTSQTALFIERNILKAIPVNCAGTNGLCNSNATISGPGIICATGQYQLNNVPNGVTINWQIQNGNLNITNGQGTPIISVSKQNTGTEIVKATITNACGASIVLTMAVTVGVPVISAISSTMTGSCNGTFQEWILTASSSSSVSSWLWTVDNPGSGSWVIYSPNSISTLVAVSGGGGISVTATNACGSSKSGVTIWSNCHALVATPNPATSNVVVSTEQTAGAPASKESIPLLYKIKVTDLPGNVKKQYDYSSGVANTTISLSGLSKGVYLIQAFDGTSWMSVKVVKE
jgi:pimeloyl-ACP methyl ester carboxylesterase